MSVWKHFSAVTVPATKNGTPKRRFSLTSDILSYRRCTRQYGYFGNDGFVPAQATQIYYGTIIHQVLDRCHRHYWGLLGHCRSTLPEDGDIDQYFDEIQNALRSRGVRPASQAVSEKARRVIKIFNRVEGPTLYPLIRDTEFRLESDQDQYILRGVVDVLARDVGAPNDPARMEIWDYKGTRLPDGSSKELRDYVWQMCVYAELYRVREGTYPARAILYFLNELDQVPEPTSRPLRAVHEVRFTEKKIQQALKEFDKTALAIIRCRQVNKWPTPIAAPEKETCDICDVRWNCTVPRPGYTLRLPIVKKANRRRR